ncbi:hypothetical protein EBZ39_00470 [bacterium]|nr:hypothetical protein [bacterium]
MTAWTVTTTKYNLERQWGARFEWMGFGCLLHIGVSSAPAIRIGILGCGIWFGRIPPKPQVQIVTKTLPGGGYADGTTTVIK